MTTSDEMGTFCHDNYEHPLLWCEEKKRLVERKNAEESLRMWRRRKAEEQARKEREKQEYYDLFVKHCPWGRPGGGAPNIDIRRKDMTAIGLHSIPTINNMPRFNSLQQCRYADYFSKHHKKCRDPPVLHPPLPHPHHHYSSNSHCLNVPDNKNPVPAVVAPNPIIEHNLGGGGEESLKIATDGKNADRLEITLKDHPSLSFRNKGHVDIEVRYKPKGKPLLEKIVVTDSDKCPLLEEKCALKSKALRKIEKPQCVKDPWGKAGPGGKPWRSPKAAGSTFMKSLGWTNNKLMKELDQDNPVTPAERSTFRKSRPTKKLIRCCDMCTCTCPAFARSPLKQIQTKKLSLEQRTAAALAANTTGTTTATTITTPQLPGAIIQPPPQMRPSNKCIYPTAGATPTLKIDSVKQKLCPRFVRCCTKEISSSNNATTTDVSGGHIASSGGGVELVPILARRRTNNRPICLSSTDVTKRTVSNERLSTADDARYLHELDKQISQKHRSQSVTKLLEKELSNKHFQTFDTYWQRPGHGAPNEIKQKLKLDNLLYGKEVQGYTVE